MGPIRLQCLNAGKQMSKSVSSLRAGFSTTSSRPAGSSLDDLLGTMDPGRQSSRRNGTPNPDNPIRSERRNRAPGAMSKHTSNILNLVSSRQQQHQNAQSSRPNSAEEIKAASLAADLTRMVSRRWKRGDVYAPHDLSAVENQKWRNRDNRPTRDVFDVLDFNPMEHYRNFSIMSEFTTEMGRIKHSKETGLRPLNQRRIARAIRRSIGMGMLPSVHAHPEIIQKRLRKNYQMAAFRDDQPSK